MTRLLRALSAFLCLCLAGVGPVLVAAPAEASVTILCKGYAGCKQAGMGNAGYRTYGDSMYWRMYAGHNCTNYAAYRLVKRGMPNERPWSGSGNAMYWGDYNAKITDDVPAVGSVAWWDQNVRPAGSAGHVAYVERVVSADEIIVSQDSWGGDFSWARITRASSGWPSGFIHFKDVPLRNVSLPVVTGEAKVGAVLEASTGDWRPSTAGYTYQWFANGAEVLNAADPTLTVRKGHTGKQISVRVTAAKLGYPTTSAYSAPTALVEPGELVATSEPTITGEPVVDGRLTASPGTWTPEPGTLSYQWSAAGSPVAGATEQTFVPGPAQVGKALRVEVTATKSGYTDVRSVSAATAPVSPGTLTATASPVLTGTARLGETLSLDPGAVTPTGAKAGIEWLRSGVPVPGATGSTYVLTADDLGARMRARVTHAKDGYTPLEATTSATRLVKSVSTMTVTTSTPRPGRLRVDLGVVAGGVDPVEGVVRVRAADGSLLGELTLTEGAARTVIRGLEPGRQRFRFRFQPTPTVTTDLLARTVRIR